MGVKALVFLVAATMATGPAYRQALELYNAGMYDRALSVFEALEDDALTDGYEVLCLLKTGSSGLDERLADYEAAYGQTSLSDQINYEYALILFDRKDYDSASARLGAVNRKGLYEDQLARYVFELGYSDYARGLFDGARMHFTELESMPYNHFKAPARYAMGFMDYNARDFSGALPWFELAARDPRFEQLANYYILECRFMLKDYPYVIEKGEEMFDRIPEERQSHLARMVSESYLVEGNKEKARDFYDLSYRENLTRSDYFYAGSVLYAVDDFAGAVENYSRMTDRTDSLGQIANYHLGGAYLELKNKVASLEAFRDAAALGFNPEMQEDAWFNYAKLAFDLNQDASGFESYIERYSTSRRGELIYGYMALSSLIRRDYAAAVAAYDNIDELDADMRGNYMKANFLRAAQLVSGGAYRDAIPCLRAASFYLPRSDRFTQLSRYWLAECYYRTGNYAEAEKTFTELYNLSALFNMQEGKLLPYNIAYSQMSQGKLESAARWLDNYNSSGDRTCREDALTRRADCDFALRRYKEAVASYQKVMDEFPGADKIYPYYRQALSAGLAGDARRKAEILSRVEGASPKAPMYDEALYELGRSYTELNRTADAVKAFGRLRDSSSDPGYVARALIGLGMVYRNAQQYENALDAYKKVVSDMGGTSYAEDALVAIESIYQKMKQPQKYLEYVEQNRLAAQKSDEEREDMYYGAAEQLYVAGNHQQALASAQTYLEQYPDGKHAADAYFYIAESYRAQGDKEKACDYYAQAVDGRDGGSYTEQALLYYSDLSYELEHFAAAYKGYGRLAETARFDQNKERAKTGMMRSAYYGRDYRNAIEAADGLSTRESKYIKAKSLMATSHRTEALLIFASLKGESSTPEGAEASYIMIQDMFDRGDFGSVERAVYDFSQNAGDQYYWLAKSFIVLGDSFAETGQTDQARVTYQSILDGYEPDGQDDILDSVKQRLGKL